MSQNVTTESGGASPNVLAELTDFDLDRKIAAQNQMIGKRDRGSRPRDRGSRKMQKKRRAERRGGLGQFLIEKKEVAWRTASGSPWLDSLRHVSAYVRVGLHANCKSNCQRWRV